MSRCLGVIETNICRVVHRWKPQEAARTTQCYRCAGTEWLPLRSEPAFFFFFNHFVLSWVGVDVYSESMNVPHRPETGTITKRAVFRMLATWESNVKFISHGFLHLYKYTCPVWRTFMVHLFRHFQLHSHPNREVKWRRNEKTGLLLLLLLLDGGAVSYV